MFIRLCILLLAQTAIDPAGPSDLPEPLSLSTRSVLIEGNGTKGPYELPDLFVVSRSEVVSKDTLLLKSGVDYYLNTKNGTILFFEPLETADPVKIRYRFFPYSIRREYRTRDVASFLKGKPVVKEVEPEEKAREALGESGIVVGGAKTFSIGAHSIQGFTFDQSLKVNITGTIAEGLSISGVLSDENTPLEAEGSTQSLEELDRIYVTIQGRGIGATLGDFDLDYHTAATPIIHRELLGVSGNLRREMVGVNMAYGIPRGRFHSHYFKGSEGKQGPYQLSGSEGEEDIVVVAGTETIFLDGILLKRGENNDYTIDYNLAQISFTSKRVITDESDIVAEFQYTRLGFKSSVSATMVSLGRDHLSLSGFYVRDADEIDQTEGFSLTDEKRSFLSTLGDDTTMSWMDGGTYVGSDKGDYSLVDSYYVYQGYNRGTWDVAFTHVGTNNGDYVYSDSISAFLYTGSNGGDYVSKIRVSLPERQQLAGLQLGYGEGERFHLSGEILGSDYDRNVLSSLNDDDNRGYFTKLKGSVPLLESNWGAINMVGDYYYRNQHFKPITRIEEHDFEERWNMSKQQGKEELRKGGMVYRKDDLVQLHAMLSVLRRQHTEATLKEGKVHYTPGGLPHLEMLSRSVTVRGDTALSSVKRNSVAVTHTLWRFIPRIQADQEIRVDANTQRWREAAGYLGFRFFKRSLLTVGYSKRLDDVFSSQRDGYDRESVITSRSFSFDTEEFSVIKSTLSIIQRERIYTSSFPGENTELLLIESSNRIVPPGRKLEIETNYAITGTRSAVFKEMFHEVAENTGDYSRDTTTGNFYPDTLGNYRRTIERIGEGNPVTALRAYIRLRSSPFTFIRGSLTASVLEENTAQRKFPIYSLQLDHFLDDSLTEQGKQSLDASLSWYPQKRTTFTYSPNFSKSLNKRYVANARRGYADRHELRIEQRLDERSKLALQYTRSRTIEERILLGLEKRERRETYAPVYSHSLLQNLELRLMATTGNVRIEEPLYYGALGLMTIRSQSIVPSCTYAMRDNAIIDASGSVLRNTTRMEETSLPFDVRSLYPIGVTTEWKVRATISVSRMVSINLVYNGLNRPDRKTLHSANAELRADF